MNDLRALVVAGAVTLGQVAPRIDRMAAFAGLAFATTVRVVDRVHHHTANGRADTHVALHTGLAELAQAVLFVGDFADGGAALDVDLANFTGAHADLGVDAFAGQQRGRGAGRTGDLRALAGLQLDAVDRRTHRDVADRQRVAGADRGFGAAQQRCADFQAARGDDVAALAVGVAHQCDVGRAVRVVLDALDLGRDAVLVAHEVDHAVVVLVATALVAGRDVAVVVAAGLLELGFQQRRVAAHPCAGGPARSSPCRDGPARWVSS